MSAFYVKQTLLPSFVDYGSLYTPCDSVECYRHDLVESNKCCFDGRFPCSGVESQREIGGWQPL